MPKETIKEETTTITLKVEKINELIKSKIDENYLNLNDENALWDSLYELQGLSEGLRKTIWNSVKSVKQIPKVEWLKDTINQMKKIKGVTETEREQIQKTQATLIKV